ncbi:hypothetical protein IEO21_04277 [Rhodonia placenta]|uniref:Uncharacterized protein n=1 Tax=Rhodonia placenta TaxID=104341 RepID=A0A8H7P4E0_9APHY|nr:hypothetical protein IEO21_04277 [Postia placenta]
MHIDFISRDLTAVCFVCDALTNVSRTRLSVPNFGDDDYTYLRSLAFCLDSEKLTLDDLSWKAGVEVTRERRLASAAVYAFTEAEWVRVADDEDEQSDVMNDNVLLLLSLNLDDRENPLKPT